MHREPRISDDAPRLIDYPCGSAPARGHASEVASGILWLRMAMPFELDHINLWALRDGDGWAIVDSGLGTDDVIATWRQLCGEGGPLAPGHLTRLFATHMHPDHVGLAGWLTREFKCWLWMTRLEYLTGQVHAADSARSPPEDSVRFYRKAGWGDDPIEHYRATSGEFGEFVHTLPDSHRRLSDGERIRIGEHMWQVVNAMVIPPNMLASIAPIAPC